MISIVTPAYNEAANLPLLYERLRSVTAEHGIEWEWLIVDDHSRDQTFAVINQLARKDSHIRGLRLARNFGAHTAMMCGLAHARGQAGIIMAADLQDPPVTIPQLVAKWREGGQVVWAVREQRLGETKSTLAFARLYYWLLRHVVGMKEIPSEGADFFLVDRAVMTVLEQMPENNVSLMALITWLGFRQTQIQYVKQARQHGKSGWNLERKLKLVVDSVTAFTYLPIRLMTYLGISIATLGFIYAGWILVNLRNSPPAGWSSLMVVVLLLGGVQMLLLGVLGEYLWRTLDESRRRPRFWVEADTKTLTKLELAP